MSTSDWLTPPRLAVQPLCWRATRKVSGVRYGRSWAPGIELLLEYRGVPVWGEVYVGLQVLPFPSGPTYVKGELMEDLGDGQAWVAEEELTRQGIEVLLSQPWVAEFGL